METNAACNRIGLTKSDYTGRPSTLCKGCGHDSITNALIQSYYELGVPPHEVMKFSGIGCSSKTPTYFIERGHGFNGVHGRMPAIATGAKVANRTLASIGVSGDGDTASIGMGQFCHLVRRNVDMLYLVENNGVYGLTKGQFSATADKGSKAKKGQPNQYETIDVCAIAIELGCNFVARSFSGDRKQMIQLMKAAYSHNGTALLDIVSPCVTFNNHEGSTKSYTFAKEHEMPLQELGYVPYYDEVQVEVKEGEETDIELQDGSILRLKKLNKEYDPSCADTALKMIHESRVSQQLLTGLLYYRPNIPDLNQMLNTTDTPLAQLKEKDLDPGPDVLKKIMAGLR